MKQHRIILLSAVFGAAGFILRLLQNRTGFTPVTGLPVPRNLPALLLPPFLLLAGIILFLLSSKLPIGPQTRPFQQNFSAEDPAMLTVLVFGVFLMAASGVWEIVASLPGQTRSILSADGMMLISESDVSPSGMVMGALSLISAVGLFFGVAACRRETVSPLPVLAAPACLLARLVFAYRLHSVNPLLSVYYLELLGLMLLILGVYRLSGFTVSVGCPRASTIYSAFSVVLALTSLADGITPPTLLTLGGAIVLSGFQFLPPAEPNTAAPPTHKTE